MKIQIPTPIQQLIHPLFKEKNIQLWIKRDDLTHPEIQGNKYRKLKYNLAEARRWNKKHLLTFGGAYSNHLYSTAAAGELIGLKTIGIVRGEKILPLNPTLKFCEGKGMQLHFVDRKTYRLKEKLLVELNVPQEEIWILPEGGTNQFALQGCVELGEEILSQMESKPDFVCLSAGTGGTATGVIQAFENQSKVLVFPALKGDWMQEEIENNFAKYLNRKSPSFRLVSDFHFGGYAKHSPALLDFIRFFKDEFDIQLDPIYTGKLFFEIFDLIKQDHFPEGSRIVGIHTGGLQGIVGFEERFGASIS